ncbi:hypothetical protein GGI43DRAFT_260346 [Trichoderma evansii]
MMNKNEASKGRAGQVEKRSWMHGGGGTLSVSMALTHGDQYPKEGDVRDVRKARQGGATPEKGVASGKLLFQRQFGAKTNQSSLAICRHQKCCCYGVPLRRLRRWLRLERCRGDALLLEDCVERLVPVPHTLDAPTIQFAERGEREDEELCSAPSSCSPHSTLPDAGTEPVAGSSHQPWPTTVCRTKGLARPFVSLLTHACVYYEYIAYLQLRTYCLLYMNVENRVHSCISWRG